MIESMIKVNNLSKQYTIGAIGGTTLRDEFQRINAKIHKKEDPTQIIGQGKLKNGDRFLALNKVSFEVRKGERVGIIGHNGAGKSTLLKLISRITAPTEGYVALNGRVASILEVGTGFHGELTGRENIYMNGAILGMTKKEIDEKLDDIIEFSECADFIDTPVKRYSSGMYVKLAFSVAAHLNSEILIMDEVLAVGDMAFQRKCIEAMNDVSREQGRTILYVSHNMSTIRMLCDRVIVLDHGTLVFDGDVEEGIGIYLGSAGNDFPLSYDLERTERPSEQHGTVLRMSNFTFSGNEQAIFPGSEPIRFCIDFYSKKNLTGLKMYFIVSAANGEPAGTAQTSSPFLDCEEGKTYRVYFSFDAGNLAAGSYYICPDFYLDDENGNHLSVDHPDCEIKFKITDEGYHGLKWQTRYFGHVLLNPIVTEKVENTIWH